MVFFLLVRPQGEDFHLISWFPICSRMAMALKDEDIQAYKSHCHCKFPALFLHSPPRFCRVCCRMPVPICWMSCNLNFPKHFRKALRQPVKGIQRKGSKLHNVPYVWSKLELILLALHFHHYTYLLQGSHLILRMQFPAFLGLVCQTHHILSQI